MNEEEILEEFYGKTIKTFTEQNILDGTYCITVTSDQKPLFIYKNLFEFKEKVWKDIKDIDSTIPIEFNPWIYD